MVVIDWLTRQDPERAFLLTDARVWAYGEVADEVRSRIIAEPSVLVPGLDASSVFEVLAGISGGGAIVVGEGDAIELGEGGLEGAALVVFTSGSTGPPKGARLTRANLEAAARASVEHLGHGSEDTWLLAMPLSHVGGLSILVRSAYAGGSVRMLPGFDVDRVVEALEGDITMVSVVPTMLRRLLDRHKGPYRGLRAVLVGGGPIPDGLLEEAAAAGLPVLPTYGMTETFGQVATLRPGATVRRRADPLPGVDIRVEDDGRIAVRGDVVSPGYLGEPDRASPWMVTSDLGSIDEDGALVVLGRADTVIITGGENVDPDHVEDVIDRCPGVREAVVTGVPDPEWGAIVVCAYVGEPDPEIVAAFARNHLPGFMVPKRWRQVDAVPRTALGKLDRLAIGELF